MLTNTLHICFENTAQLALLFDPQTFDYNTFHMKRKVLVNGVT